MNSMNEMITYTSFKGLVSWAILIIELKTIRVFSIKKVIRCPILSNKLFLGLLSKRNSLLTPVFQLRPLLATLCKKRLNKVMNEKVTIMIVG